MSQVFMLSFYMVFRFILCQGSNLDYSFNAASFNFSAWQRSNEGFQCPRDNLYAILCKYGWDTVALELGDCAMGDIRLQCARTSNITLFILIVIEGIAIGVLVLYICKKPKIDARGRVELQNWLMKMSK